MKSLILVRVVISSVYMEVKSLTLNVMVASLRQKFESRKSVKVGGAVEVLSAATINVKQQQAVSVRNAAEEVVRYRIQIFRSVLFVVAASSGGDGVLHGYTVFPKGKQFACIGTCHTSNPKEVCPPSLLSKYAYSQKVEVHESIVPAL